MSYLKRVHCISIRQACELVLLVPSVYYYKPKRKDDDQIRDRLAELATLNTTWGFWMRFPAGMFHRLRNLDYQWNHKRVYRVYKEMKLNLRCKYKRRLPYRVKEPLLQPIFPNVTWSMAAAARILCMMD